MRDRCKEYLMNSEQSIFTKGKQKRVTLWIAGIFSLVILAFLGFSLLQSDTAIISMAYALEKFMAVSSVLAVLVILAFVIRHSTAGSIRTQLVAIFVVVAVISMGIVAFFADQSLRNNLTADIVESQSSLATS